MRRNPVLLTFLVAICFALLVHASPTRGKSPSPGRRPPTPVRRPSIPVKVPTHPVVIHKKPVVVTPKKPIVVHPVPSHGTVPAHKPQPVPVPVHHTIPPVVHHPVPPSVHHSIPPPAHSVPASHPSVPTPVHQHAPTPVQHGAHPAQPTHSTLPVHPPTGSGASGSHQPQLSPLDVASRCPTHTSCDACAAQGSQFRSVRVAESNGKKVTKKVKCGWQQADTETHGRCVTIESTQTHTSSLITDPDHCTALYERVSDHQRHSRALVLWNKMESHVFKGNPAGHGKDEAGCHLASNWLVKFPHDQIDWNSDTLLGQSQKGKTLWKDEAYSEGTYTTADVKSMCVEAIALSIKERQVSGRRTPESQQSEPDDENTMEPMRGQHAYVVASPRTGHNICVNVFDTYSCFPALITPMTGKFVPGTKCAMDSRILD